MKLRNLNLIVVAIAMVAVCCVSCHRMKPAEEVAGTYKGYSLASCAFFQDQFTAEESLVLSQTSDNTVSLSYTSSTWGNLIMKDVLVTKEGGTYSLVGDGEFTMTSHSGEPNTFSCSMTATLSGSKVMTMTITIPDLMNGTTIVFKTGQAALSLYVAGSYPGKVTMTVGANAYDPVEATIKVTVDDDDDVKITLPAMGEGQMSIPEILVEDVSVKSTDYKTFTIPAKEIEQTVGGVNFTGTLSGTLADGKLTLNYSLQPGSMPMSITFAFNQD